ncbi:hypothetical protein SAMN02745166_03152 [Prosthecobacter debontii]|uniref:Uncharacterized protein n=1 Tax=Prosthecobacter debontii TaxID=48467 RepID=A0A1T4YFE5_9BACT|nr:hypothetical protein SAMN02745166_03152 [Prosthecobacter debontii]
MSGILARFGGVGQVFPAMGMLSWNQGPLSEIQASFCQTWLVFSETSVLF